MPSREPGVDAEFKVLMAEMAEFSRPVPRSETRDWLAGDDGS
jgi:hypothetical protein